MFDPPKARHSYLLLNHLGRVSMLHETYQIAGIRAEASMPNPKIVRRLLFAWLQEAPLHFSIQKW
jgi:hypothetical protein